MESIRSSNIRVLIQYLIVGLEREGQRLLNPDSDFIFQQDDTNWGEGNKNRLRILARQS